MTPTLALEQLMLHPQYDRLIDALRQVAPVHVVDQADAAAADALRLVTTIGTDALGTDVTTPTTAGGTPGWLRLGLLDALTAWVDGRASTCRHNPHPARPTPVVAAAWRPALVACPACAHLVALPRGSERDRTCDACGRVCAGPEHGDGIWPGMLQLGPLVYQYGTCTGCRPAITPDPGPLRRPETAEQDHPRGAGRVRPRGHRGRQRGKGGR
ncbi:hypothetical protein [Micromonospora maritima]|uniref:hypothetical protein n=1 Tax=Micromonospora maritima TaxID=986711 RepID=UPI00157DC566|nr:hypothetical protein [Micromonospora maritima]